MHLNSNLCMARAGGPFFLSLSNPIKGHLEEGKKKHPIMGLVSSTPPIRLSQFQFQESEFCRCNAVGNYKTRCSLISFVVPNNFQEELTP